MNGISATSAREIQVGGLVVEGVGVLAGYPGVVVDRFDRSPDGGGQAHGDRDVGAGADRGPEGGMTVERRIPRTSTSVWTRPLIPCCAWRLSDDHRRAGVGDDRGEQCVQSADPGVAVSEALFAMPVDLDDRIVAIDQHPPGTDAGDPR